MKRGSNKVRLSNAKADVINVNGKRWVLRRMPLVLTAACALALLVGASASNDYYQCYQYGTCAEPTLSNDSNCRSGTDYDVTISNKNSRVTVLSFHGGNIESDTSGISNALSNLFVWSRYDFNAHATSACTSVGTYQDNKLHITSTNFNDPRAVSLVSAQPKAVAIHGYGDWRGYAKGVMCVGGKDTAARSAFISYVNNNAATWNANPNTYPLMPIDATAAAANSTCGDLRGTDDDNLVNRTSSHAGLQLELSNQVRADLVNAAASYDDLRNLIYGATREAMIGQRNCVTADSTGAPWQNRALASNQTGTFTAEMDATPLGINIDTGVGLSNGAQTSYAGLACIVRFNSQGRIDARNGGAYTALSQISYSPNTSYHLRFAVNVPAHTYSVYVTPAGGSEQAVGINYTFRTEQATVGSLNNWSLFSDTGSMRGCGFAAPCYAATAGGNWTNNSFASQAGTFKAEWDATPSANNVDAVVGLSNGAQTSFSGFACLTRFNTSGTIDARDGGIYRASSSIPYAANATYHFRLAVNAPAHTYSVYITPPGGSELALALNYAFRTEQATVGSLNNYGLIVDSAVGSARVCNFAFSGSNTLFQDSFTGADGLITNEYADSNSDGILSPDWDMTSGSLFRQSNTAWTGLPDSLAPNKYSSDHTGSDVFRVNTFRTFAGNIKVSLALKNNSEIHNSNCSANDTCWHGVHIWLRHLTQYDLYAVSLNRADNKVIIKRKVPCGNENDGFYKDLTSPVMHAWSVGTWQHYSVTIQTNSDGSITIKVYDDDSDPNTPFLQATDAGGTNTSWTSGCTAPGRYPTAQYPPITAAGSVGVRGDFDNFNFDDFRISSF
jgi:phage replication-related protein YjqB (UPF0714/DUF867 family)